ncbi:hypothetical protein ACIRBX_14100 [Kitasatospora sp. NPDC096147]|uniref:hypothetical protein n=1 Tax=Kitasatospora sp. NPDC096147 TaxID=3364093 RepID=UPI00382BF134
MPTHGIDPFTAWLAVLAEESELQLDPAGLSPDALAWLRDVRDGHGEVPPPYLAELVLARRTAVAAAALARLRPVVERETGLPLDLWLEVEQASEYDPIGSARLFGEHVRSPELEDARVTVAEAVQTYLASRHRVVWPVCPDHRTGLHADLTDGRAAWHCRPGGHHLPMP